MIEFTLLGITVKVYGRPQRGVVGFFTQSERTTLYLTFNPCLWHVLVSTSGNCVIVDIGPVAVYQFKV